MTGIPATLTVDVDAFCSWSMCSIRMTSSAFDRTGLTSYFSEGKLNIMCRMFSVYVRSFRG